MAIAGSGRLAAQTDFVAVITSERKAGGNSLQIIVLLLLSQFGSFVITLSCVRASFQPPCSFLRAALAAVPPVQGNSLAVLPSTEGLRAASHPSPLFHSWGVLCHP